MSLASISGDGGEQVKSEIDKATAKGRELVGYYEALTGNHVPKSLEEALKEDWQGALSESARELLEFYSPHDQKADRKRVMRIEDAVKLLEDFEQELIKVAVIGTDSIAVAPMVTTVKQCEFVIEHIGHLIVGLLDVLLQFKGLIFEAIKGTLSAALRALLDLSSPADIIKATLEAAYNHYKVISAAVVAVAMALAGTTVLSEFLEKLGKVPYKAGVKRMLNKRNNEIAAVRAKALKQGKGRVRRRKRGRR